MKKLSLVLILILSLSFALHAESVGDQAGNIVVKDYDGNTQSIAKYRGKVILLKFWASWCGPCVRSLPKTKSIHDKYSSRGLVVFAVGLGSPARDQALLNQYNCNFKVKVPGRNYRTIITSNYRFRGIPHEILISKTGKILFKGHPSSLNESLIETALNGSGGSTTTPERPERPEVNTTPEPQGNNNDPDGKLKNLYINENANSVDFNRSYPLVGANIKYRATGTIYPKVRSNFWGKVKHVNIGMIKRYKGYMEFKFKGAKTFNILAAGGAIGGRSQSNIDIYINGRKVTNKFFLNQWWNYYHVPSNLMRTGTNTIKIVNVSRAVPWIFKAWISEGHHRKSRSLVMPQ